jgi:conjugal transfer mating pair stabilization protein TraG
MQDFEIFTTGGGWFLFNFFNAIAAIAQSAAFGQAITGAMLTGGGWILLSLAFDQRGWNKVGNWLAVSTIAVSGFLAPVSTVKITDVINRVDSSSYIVSNVPLGLALFAGLTSLTGQELTELFEQNFSDPDTPTLHENGFLFGVRLLTESTRMEIKDNNLDQSLSSFIRNCVFYDLATGRKNIEDLKTAPDPWVWITNDAHVARMFEFQQTNNSEIVTCAAGVGRLNTAMGTEVTEAQNRLSAGVTSERTNRTRAAVRAVVATELSSFHQYLIGQSRTAADILRRQMVINAVMQEPANWMSETGNEAGLKNYIDARLQLQTRQSYESVARQAEKWVPILKTVFQCIYIGIFPIAILLMVTPIGSMVIRNYILGLVWVESWQPLYALLNYMMNTKAREQMRSILEATSPGSAPADITLFAQAGIQAVEKDISIQAGYLSMSIPFIALGLAMGVGRFAALATSTLAVSQEAVASTTAESATGNISIGTSGFDSHAFHNYSGHQHNSSSTWDAGRYSSYAPDGTHITQNPNDNLVSSARESISNFGTGVDLSGRLADSYSTLAEQSRTAAQGHSASLTETQSALASDTRNFADTISRNDTSAIQYQQGESSQVSDDFRIVQQAASELAQTHNVSDEEALRAMAAAQVTLGGSLGGQKLSLGGRAELRGQYDSVANSSISYQDALRASESEQVSESLQRLSNASSTESAGWSIGTGESYSDTVEARHQEINSLDERHDASLQDAERYAAAAQHVASNSAGYNQNLSQSFVEWLGQTTDASGNIIGDTDAHLLLNSPDAADQHFVRTKASEFVEQVAADHISAVDQPDLGGRFETARDNITGAADIAGHAQTNAGSIPDGGDIADNHKNNAVEVASSVSRQLGDADAGITAGQDKVGETQEELNQDVTNQQNQSKAARLGDNIVDETKAGLKALRGDDGQDYDHNQNLPPSWRNSGLPLGQSQSNGDPEEEK